MAVRYYNDDCTYRLPEKRRTARWLGNARIYGATTLQEMRRVVVHGVLHLCGQRDKTPRTNAQMHRKEDRYLAFWHEEEASEQSAAPAPKRAKRPAHSKK